MEGRTRVLLLTLALMLGSAGAASAQDEQPIEPRLERREIVTPAIDTENFEAGVFAGLMAIEDFGSEAVVGARLAYHVTEGLFVEASIGRSKAGETSFERLGGAVELLTDDERELQYYTLSAGYNLLPGEAFIAGRAFNTALYLIAGAGSTEFGGDSRFSISYGAGYRFLASDWLALHLDVRDLVFDHDLLGEEKTTHNIMFHGGVTVFF